MNKRELSQLQRLINNTVKASNAFERHNRVLMNFCIEKYGCEPGDIDVLGGMTAEEFDTIMTEGSGDRRADIVARNPEDFEPYPEPKHHAFVAVASIDSQIVDRGCAICGRSPNARIHDQ